MANQRGTIHTFGPEKKLTIVTNTQGIGSDKRRIATVVVVILQWIQAVTVIKKIINWWLAFCNIASECQPGR